MVSKGFTIQQLKFARWYLRNKRKIRLILLLLVILLNLIFWSIAGYQLTIYLSSKQAHKKALQELTTNQIDFLEIHEHFQPEDLIIEKPTALRLSSLKDKQVKYDFLAEVKNTNKNWLALVEYYFDCQTSQTEKQKNFILPGQKKYLFSLGEELNQGLTDLEFVFSNVQWKRINPQDEKLLILQQIKVKDIYLEHEVSPEKMIALPKISFQAKNQSVYNFWEVDFKVILFQGPRIVGLNTVWIKEWQSNEDRIIEVLWPEIPDYNSIKIVPEINPFNPEIFIPVY